MRNFGIKIVVVVMIICMLLLLLFLGIRLYDTYKYDNNDYYSYYKIKNDVNSKEDKEEEQYTTIINHTNKYINQKIDSLSDAISLIEEDSHNQESKCDNNLEEIENDIKNKTKIYGINLCEMSYDYAEKIDVTLGKIYGDYPWLKNYVTNLTLVNDGGRNSYIAAFKPSFTFATSDSKDKFPFVIKIQVFLNSSYYLDEGYFKRIINNANTNYFPMDTTEESLVAHEFGHVITYILAIQYYKSFNTVLLEKRNFNSYANTLNKYVDSSFSRMLFEEAYCNYEIKYGNISQEKYRSNISEYANTIDSNGDILYNETIAEAFHDYFLHGTNAKIESLEIVKVLESYAYSFFGE